MPHAVVFTNCSNSLLGHLKHAHPLTCHRSPWMRISRSSLSQAKKRRPVSSTTSRRTHIEDPSSDLVISCPVRSNVFADSAANPNDTCEADPSFTGLTLKDVMDMIKSRPKGRSSRSWWDGMCSTSTPVIFSKPAASSSRDGHAQVSVREETPGAWSDYQ